MKNSILTFITIFSLALLVSCGGNKGKENQAEAGAENAENTETGTAESSLDMGKPCEWVSEDFVKSTLELKEEFKLETKDASDKYGNVGCDYEWSEEGSMNSGSLSILFGGKAATYENAQKAEDAMQSGIDVLKKGITSEVDTDKGTEEVMEGSEGNKDGKIKTTFKLEYTRIDKEAGFPAAFKPHDPNSEAIVNMSMLMFVVENKTMSITYMGMGDSKKDPDTVKTYLIDIAKKIREK